MRNLFVSVIVHKGKNCLLVMGLMVLVTPCLAYKCFECGTDVEMRRFISSTGDAVSIYCPDCGASKPESNCQRESRVAHGCHCAGACNCAVMEDPSPWSIDINPNWLIFLGAAAVGSSFNCDEQGLEALGLATIGFGLFEMWSRWKSDSSRQGRLQARDAIRAISQQMVLSPETEDEFNIYSPGVMALFRQQLAEYGPDRFNFGRWEMLLYDLWFSNPEIVPQNIEQNEHYQEVRAEVVGSPSSSLPVEEALPPIIDSIDAPAPSCNERAVLLDDLLNQRRVMRTRLTREFYLLGYGSIPENSLLASFLQKESFDVHLNISIGRWVSMSLYSLEPGRFHMFDVSTGLYRDISAGVFLGWLKLLCSALGVYEITTQVIPSKPSARRNDKQKAHR